MGNALCVVQYGQNTNLPHQLRKYVNVVICSLTLFKQNSIYSEIEVFSTGNNRNILLYISLMRFDKMGRISVLIYSVLFSLISCYKIKMGNNNNNNLNNINCHNPTSILS